MLDSDYDSDSHCLELFSAAGSGAAGSTTAGAAGSAAGVSAGAQAERISDAMIHRDSKRKRFFIVKLLLGVRYGKTRCKT